MKYAANVGLGYSRAKGGMDVAGIRAPRHLTTPGGRLHINPCILSTR